MSKIGKLFRAIGMIIRKPSLLNHVLDDNDTWKKKVLDRYGMKDGLPVLDFNSFLTDDSGTIQPLSLRDGASPITDMIVLRALAARLSSCDYLEIGTWRGESVANVARVAVSCVTIDLPEDADRKSTRLNSSHIQKSRMPSSA